MGPEGTGEFGGEEISPSESESNKIDLEKVCEEILEQARQGGEVNIPLHLDLTQPEQFREIKHLISDLAGVVVPTVKEGETDVLFQTGVSEIITNVQKHALENASDDLSDDLLKDVEIDLKAKKGVNYNISIIQHGMADVERIRALINPQTIQAANENPDFQSESGRGLSITANIFNSLHFGLYYDPLLNNKKVEGMVTSIHWDNEEEMKYAA